jgi:hypothetical protein
MYLTITASIDLVVFSRFSGSATSDQMLIDLDNVFDNALSGIPGINLSSVCVTVNGNRINDTPVPE